MIHSALGRIITARAFHTFTVKGAFDTAEKGYLIHWVTGCEVLVALAVAVVLTVALYLTWEARP